jgi:CRISPR-associated RAMP protein (TIGR02581 family)
MMFDEFRNRLVLSGRLVAQTALRVGAGRATEPVGSDLPVLRDTQDRPYIPGSSFKGVLRSRIESVVRAVAGEEWGACIPVNPDELCVRRGSCKSEKWPYPSGGKLPEKPIGIEDLSRGLAASERDATLASRVWDNSCLVCRTFGSPWLASHVQIKDLLVDAEMWFGQFQVRDGVAIDRDTETAAEGLLYNYEVVPADVRFQCEIVVENAKPWQLGMLFLGLKPFETGEIAIGGFRSRGLGSVKLEWEGRYFEVPQGNPGQPGVEWVIRYLEGKEGGVDARKLVDGWIGEFRRELADTARRIGEKHA